MGTRGRKGGTASASPVTPARKTRQARAPKDGETVDLARLVADPENRRRHNERNLGMVAASLREVGAARSIVIDEAGVILAGNGVAAGAKDAGIGKVRIIDADGDELIAVRRSNLTEAQKRALAIYDNRAGELATWNIEQLSKDAADGLTLRPWFGEKELAKLKVKRLESAPSVGSVVNVSESYQILVTCDGETAQAELLGRLTEEGFSCRALMS